MGRRRTQLGKNPLGRDINRLIVAVNSAPTIVSGADHGALTGLDGDDHSQYFHLTQDEVVTGNITFNTGAAEPPFVLHANNQGQTVIGFQADNLNKDVIAGAGMTGGGELTSDVTLNVIAGDGINVNADSVEVDVTDFIGAGLVEIATNNIGLADSVAGGGLSIDGSKVMAVATGTGIEILSDQVIHSTGDFGDVHTNYAEHDQAETITGAWTWSTDLLPTTVDTYDIGSAVKLWRKGYLSELEALLFVENAIHVEGGWLIVGHDSGTLDEDINASVTTVDFGKAMTTGDFVLLRGSLKTEYMTVGTLDSGTSYNVSRGVDDGGTGNIWPQGQVFLVLGNVGDGRVELVANQSDSPRMSIFEQGSAYNVQTEYVRIGNMRNAFDTGSNNYWGLGVGDYGLGNYLRYNSNDGFKIAAGGEDVIIDEDGISIFGASDNLAWYTGTDLEANIGRVTDSEGTSLRLFRGTADGSDLITNGDFETDVTGWTATGEADIVRSATQAKLGSYSGYCQMAGDIGLGDILTTSYIAVSGNAGRFSSWLYVTRRFAEVTMVLKWYNSVSSLLQTDSVEIGPVVAGWVYHEVLGSKPATATKVKVGWHSASGSVVQGDWFYVDDVQFFDLKTNTTYINLLSENVSPWSSTITLKAAAFRFWTGKVIVGDGMMPAAQLHSVKVTEQLRLGYDASKYASFTVQSTGTLVIGAINDIYLQPAGDSVFIDGDSAQQLRLRYDASNHASFEATSTGQLTITPTGSLVRMAGTSPTIRFSSGSSTFDMQEVAGELRLGGSAGTGVSITNGLRVGDSSSPTNDDIRAAADIVAGGGLYAGLITGEPSTGHVWGTGDFRCSGGLTVGNITTNMPSGSAWIGAKIYINETTNANQPIGLTIRIGSDATYKEAISLKATDVGHGMTSVTETDTWFYIEKLHHLGGGADILAATDAYGANLGHALSLRGVAYTQYTGKSTTSTGVVTLQGMKANGATVQALAASGNVFVVKGYTNAHFIVDESGMAWSRVAASSGDNQLGNFDDYRDMDLLTGLRASLMPIKSQLRESASEFIKYARPILEEAGIVVYNDGPGEDGVAYGNHMGLQLLTIDAVRQFHGNQTQVNHQLAARIKDLESQVRLLTAG